MSTKYSISGLQSGKFFSFLQWETPLPFDLPTNKFSGCVRRQGVSIKKERESLSFFMERFAFGFPSLFSLRHEQPDCMQIPLDRRLFSPRPFFSKISDAKRRRCRAAFLRISFPIRQGHIPLPFQTGALSPQIPQNAAARWRGICEVPLQCPKTPDG